MTEASVSTGTDVLRHCDLCDLGRTAVESKSNRISPHKLGAQSSVASRKQRQAELAAGVQVNRSSSSWHSWVSVRPTGTCCIYRPIVSYLSLQWRHALLIRLVHHDHVLVGDISAVNERQRALDGDAVYRRVLSVDVQLRERQRLCIASITNQHVILGRLSTEDKAFNWRAPWKNRTSRYISFFRPSLNDVLFPMFCLLVEGECQILVF